MILNQVTIPCIDYAESVAFYHCLGLTQIVDAPPRYARFESADGGGATLSLHTVESVVATGTVIYFDHGSREALERHVVELKTRGVTFASEPQEQRWGWCEARLLDPAGNEVCLMFAGENRRFPAWRLDGRQR
ncbi:MAG: VOC family protein [Haliea sp.]|uniref:VOC family protein n=1 Tax=Haliea sp. TaxID=1932666 RepID=UPI0032EB4ECA